MRLLTIVVVTLLSLPLSLAACAKKVEEPDTKPTTKAAPVKDEFQAIDEKVGAGAEAKQGSKVKVHYTGKLKNGEQFDSSVGRDPFELTIGQGQVIAGWEKGLVGMKVGGKRKLVIPSDLGYGDRGSPPKIPGKATLYFDIELLDAQ